MLKIRGFFIYFFMLSLLVCGCSDKKKINAEIINIFDRHSAEKPDLTRIKTILDREGPDGLKKLDKYCGMVFPGQKINYPGILLKQKLGIGIMLYNANGNFFISKVFKNSPADKVGIREKDILLEIGSQKIKGLSTEQAQNLLGGAENTYAIISLLRKSEEGGEKIIRFKVLRQPLRVSFIWSMMFPDKPAAYVKILFLIKGFPAIFKKELEKLVSLGVRHVILDLRWLEGGDIEDIAATLRMFVGGKKLLFKIVSRHEGYSRDYSAEDASYFENLKIILLVNGDTTSGPEVLASSLLENKKALIIGSKTSGSASIQKTFKLSDNNGFKLTIARFLGPSSSAIEEKGVSPDIEVYPDETLSSEIKNLWSTNSLFVVNKDPSLMKALAEIK